MRTFELVSVLKVFAGKAAEGGERVSRKAWRRGERQLRVEGKGVVAR
jgi:hypothetical protein